MDIARRLKQTREEIVKFQQSIHAKILEQDKVTQEIQEIEKKIREAKALEREMSLKRSIHSRIGIELTRLNSQKRRLEQEIPNMEYEIQKMKSADRFGGHALQR